VAEQLASLSADDDRYVRAHFVRLEWLAAKTKVSRATLHQWQRQEIFPRPTYVTADGEQWYPRAYVGPVQRAKSLKTDLKTLFYADYKRAMEQLRYLSRSDYEAELSKSSTVPPRLEEVIESEWKGFLSGEYGVCLRVAWVPCILRKGKLMRTIEELVARPRPDNPLWRIRLRRSVEALDQLEMPFADSDRIRFGRPVSRDTHILGIRRRFPKVFGLPVEAPADTLPDSPPSISAMAPEC
jgi:hypothetical protein